MKKTFLVLGIVATLAVAAMAALLYWLQGELELERNRKRTANATANRWVNRAICYAKGEDPDLELELELDKEAQEIVDKNTKTATDEKEST